MSSVAARPRVPAAAFAVLLGGVSAALHLGKLPPAVPALQASLGIGLVEAGFLLSLVQVASMTLGLLVGPAAGTHRPAPQHADGAVRADGREPAGRPGRPSADGGAHAVQLAASACAASRSIGFLLAVMPGPGLIRALTPPGADKAALGLWGAYMPLGVALALLLGPP